MRNLKRALSLALASIMVLSMMVVGAGAVSIDDFSDSENIVNKEAVTTMVSLGVINGKDDGSYDPQGIVTRAEMAKLISVMLNGGKDPTLGAITANFSDTAGHWAENYIAYVSNLKIVDGRGDGTFGPNDQVTGAQAAKMLLTALGYRSEIEGFTGANWAVNVQLKGNDIQLFEGLSINPDEGLSRDNTAQMIYNAVQAQEVEYRNLDGNYNDVIYPTNKGTMLANRFGVVKVEGLVAANDIFAVPGASTTTVGRTRLIDTNTYATVTNSDGTVTNRNYNGVYNVAVDNDMVGTRIVIYVKFQNALAPNATNSTVVGTPISSEKNTIATTAGRLKDDAAVRSFLSDNGLTLPTEGVENTSATTTGTLFFTEKDTQDSRKATRDFAVTSKSSVNGTELTFIDHNDDGVVDYIFKTLPRMAKVTLYNESGKALTIAGEGSIDFSDIANYEDVARDDIVLYHKVNETFYISKAETVSGQVTAYNDSNKKLTLDGEQYGQSTVIAEESSTDLTKMEVADGGGMEFVGNTYTFYLDNHGNVAAWILGEESVGNYALVLASDKGSSSVVTSGEVKLLLADGTVANYTVNLLASATKFGIGGTNSNKETEMANRLETDSASGKTGLTNQVVTYVLGENGRVTLGDPSQVARYAVKTGTATQAVARSTGSYTVDGQTVKVNDNTLFFVRNVTRGSGQDDYTVVNGVSKLPTSRMIKGTSTDSTPVWATVESVVYTTTSANPNVARAVFVDASYKGTASYVYVTDSYTGTQTINGERVYTYPVVFEDGTAGTLNISDNDVDDGQVYEYTVNTDGVADVDDTSSDIKNGYVSTYARGSNLSVRAGDGVDTTVYSHTVLSDAKLWNVEDEPYAETLTDSMSMCFVLDADGFVKTVFVDDTNAQLVNVRKDTGVGGTLSANNVYTGYKVRVTDIASGSTVAYTVTYQNGTTRNLTATAGTTAPFTASITVPSDAASILITSTSASGGVTPPVGGEITVTVPATETNYYAATFLVNGAPVTLDSDRSFKMKGSDILAVSNVTGVVANSHYMVANGLVVDSNASSMLMFPANTLAGNVTLKNPTVMFAVQMIDGGATVTVNSGDHVVKGGVTYVASAAVVKVVTDATDHAIVVDDPNTKLLASNGGNNKKLTDTTSASTSGNTFSTAADVWVYPASEVTKVAASATVSELTGNDAYVVPGENLTVTEGGTATVVVAIPTADFSTVKHSDTDVAGTYVVGDADMTLAGANQIVLTGTTATYGSSTAITSGDYVVSGTSITLALANPYSGGKITELEIGGDRFAAHDAADATGAQTVDADADYAETVLVKGNPANLKITLGADDVTDSTNGKLVAIGEALDIEAVAVGAEDVQVAINGGSAVNVVGGTTGTDDPGGTKARATYGVNSGDNTLTFTLNP